MLKRFSISNIVKISKNIKSDDGEEIIKSRVFLQFLCFCLTIAFLVGCAYYSSTGVFPSGKDTCTIVVSGRGTATVGDLQKMDYQEANDFCRS